MFTLGVHVFLYIMLIYIHIETILYKLKTNMRIYYNMLYEIICYIM